MLECLGAWVLGCLGAWVLRCRGWGRFWVVERKRVAGSNYRDLLVWQQAIELSLSVYQETENFPNAEKYGLTSQMRRAAASIPANLAEGSGRNSKKEFAHFVAVAIGSLRELETFVEIAWRLGYLSDHRSLIAQCDSVSRLLTRLRVSLQKASS